MVEDIYAHYFDVFGDSFAVSFMPCLLTVNTLLPIVLFTHCFMPFPDWLGFKEHTLVPSTPQHNHTQIISTTSSWALAPVEGPGLIRVLQAHMMSPPGSIACMDMSMYLSNYKGETMICGLQVKLTRIVSSDLQNLMWEYHLLSGSGMGQV